MSNSASRDLAVIEDVAQREVTRLFFDSLTIEGIERTNFTPWTFSAESRYFSYPLPCARVSM